MIVLNLLLYLMQKQVRGLDFCYKNVNYHSLVIRKRPDCSDLSIVHIRKFFFKNHYG